jgi:hypothetical protein
VTDLYVFDAAYAPDLAAVRRAGGIAVNGYLTGSYAGTTTQVAAAHAAGLGYVPTYEQGASELVNAPRTTGQAVGQRIAAAFAAHGIPQDGTVAVYPSVDVSVPFASPGACDNAWRGMRDVLGHAVSLRAYAEGAVIDHLAATGLVDGKSWLAAPTSWPGYRVDDGNVCMIQQVGTFVAGTDRNHLVTDPHSLGAYWPSGSPYREDPLMSLTLEQIAAAVWDHPLRNPVTHVSQPAVTRVFEIGAAINKIPTRPVETDAAAVAAAILSQLGPAVAAQVAAELARRLTA